ncbi:non-specific lipid-transfer protein-like [Salvia divinorum]|uniref:Non-specific lipid-transfer protein-like n=1 Tax=Salvia divinorum TaxID=28513 RepID=A0ABD1GMP1_SALDI
MAKYWAIFIALFLSVMLLVPNAHAATCDTVVSSLEACGSAMQKGGTVTTECCSGIKSLSKSTNTPAARKTVCHVRSKFPASTPTWIVTRCINK